MTNECDHESIDSIGASRPHMAFLILTIHEAAHDAALTDADLRAIVAEATRSVVTTHRPPKDYRSDLERTRQRHAS